MELLAAGRDADVYAIDEDRVLRRFRHDADTAYEARVMTFLHEQGYPVPQVYDADGRDMVIERLYGAVMFDVMTSKPWQLRRHLTMLVDLQARLHAIPAPEWLATSLRGVDLDGGADGARVLHLDLHPLNVILTDRGPVVIDWTNAAAGNPSLDVALTYLTLAGAQMPGAGPQRAVAETFRGLLLRGLRARWREGVRDVLSKAADIRKADPNLTAAEAERTRRVAQRLQ